MLRTGPQYKIAKRLGAPVFEKTTRPQFTRSKERGKKKMGAGRRPRALSSFGKQLLEKQKMRYLYGLHEKQFSNYVAKATATHGAVPSDTLYRLIESRLDNVIYRLGIAATRMQARQLVSHGHITVNGRKVTIPSREVREGDSIGIREGSRGRTVFAPLFVTDRETPKTPSWLLFDAKKCEGKVVGTPAFAAGVEIYDIALVLEFYSR